MDLNSYVLYRHFYSTSETWKIWTTDIYNCDFKETVGKFIDVFVASKASYFKLDIVTSPPCLWGLSPGFPQYVNPIGL